MACSRSVVGHFGWRKIHRFSGLSTSLWSRHSSSTPPRIEPDLPDYKTSVDVHTHKLTRPDKPPGSFKRKWSGLDGLAERTKGSLIPETLEAMESDEDFKITSANLKKLGQAKLTRQERKNRQRALDDLGVPDFRQFWVNQKKQHGVEDRETVIRRSPTEILQLNVGLYCNQACNHCHVESSPKRKEMMSRDVADRCLHLLANSPTIHTVDITGGAPELCTEFRYLASESRKLGRKVIDRTNLTVFQEPGQEDLGEFLASNRIDLIASLPCYTAKNVNLQRGKGVFDRSVQALIMLNDLGYGHPGSDLNLHLVYNPLGAYLPPDQVELKDQYKKELMDIFGVAFNDLFTMTNMPIKRFADFLYRRNELPGYMELLVRNYNLNTVDQLMCRNTLNVSYDGRIFDCDFNQQLSIPIEQQQQQQEDSSGSDVSRNSPPDELKKGMTVFDLESASALTEIPPNNDNHCFGCTAGMGSS